jgi:hypothetical protein
MLGNDKIFKQVILNWICDWKIENNNYLIIGIIDNGDRLSDAIDKKRGGGGLSPCTEACAYCTPPLFQVRSCGYSISAHSVAWRKVNYLCL